MDDHLHEGTPLKSRGASGRTVLAVAFAGVVLVAATVLARLGPVTDRQAVVAANTAVSLETPVTESPANDGDPGAGVAESQLASVPVGRR